VTAFIADITTMEERSKALGFMSASISTGFIIGPGIGGFLVEVGSRVPFFFAAAIAFVAAALSLLMLHEPARNDEEDVAEMESSGWKRIFVPMYFIAFMIIFISSFSLSAFESLFSLYVDRKFAFTPKDIAIAIAGGAIIGAVAQVAFFDWLTKHLGEIGLIRYCLIISIILVWMMTVVNSYVNILLVTVVLFVGFDLIRPAVTSYLSKIAGNEQGFVGGMNSMFTSIGNVLGPVLGGILFDIDFDYPFYFSAIFLAIGAIISLTWKPPPKNPLVE